MQHWLDRLTDLSAIQGDESTFRQALGHLAGQAGFGGYAYLHIQPGHTLAISNYHPEWRSIYFKRKFITVDPVVKRAKSLKRPSSGAVNKAVSIFPKPSVLSMLRLPTSASALASPFR